MKFALDSSAKNTSFLYCGILKNALLLGSHQQCTVKQLCDFICVQTPAFIFLQDNIHEYPFSCTRILLWKNDKTKLTYNSCLALGIYTKVKSWNKRPLLVR